MATLVRVPLERLQPATLRSLLEEFVSRDGTDYGAEEVPLDTRVGQLLGRLERSQVAIVYDLDSDQWDFVEHDRLGALDLAAEGAVDRA